MIQLESSNGPRGALGVSVWDDPYNGKTERKLKITPSAKVSIVEDKTLPQSKSVSVSKPSSDSKLKEFSELFKSCFDAANNSIGSIQKKHDVVVNLAFKLQLAENFWKKLA